MKDRLKDLAAKHGSSSSRFSWDPATPNHIALRQAILDKQIVLVNGPMGSGKTFNSLLTGLELLTLSLKNGGVEKIVAIRPIVPCGKDLGAVPGGIDEKIDPYNKAIFQTIEKSGHPQSQALLDGDRLEIIPLQVLRGQTLEDAFIVLDEAQNVTIKQMEMLFGRLGPNSKLVVCGDINQKDFDELDGFSHALQLFGNDPLFGHIELDYDDIQRAGIIKHILIAYARDRERVTENRKLRAAARVRTVTHAAVRDEAA